MSSLPRPLALIAELTYRCPLHCPYCSNPLALSRYRLELSTAAWRRVLREAAELGVLQVHFTGGEPLLRDDLVDLVAAARTVGLYPHLSTGGTLATEGYLRRLQEAGLRAVQISLLDSAAAENDYFSQTESFPAKTEAIRAARRLGMFVTLNVVLHRHNIERVAAIVETARQFAIQKLELAHAQYVGWAFRNRTALLPSRTQVEFACAEIAALRSSLPEMEIVEVLSDYFQDIPKRCLHGWGQVFLTVAPDGAVLPCPAAREIEGLEFPNVEDSSLEAIWFGSSVFNRFRGTGWMKEPCRSCPHKESDYGGCRCQAYLLTGDPAVADPVCVYSPHHSLVESSVQERAPVVHQIAFRRNCSSA